ncbi:hypothetical protein GJAV_G00257060 [Gymnothorax javanicus]|nr:hypothetical protein GJAV_G00257060 [Gymnothorax javanicus]
MTPRHYISYLAIERKKMSHGSTRPSLLEHGNDEPYSTHDSPPQRRRSARLCPTVSSQNTTEVNDNAEIVVPPVKRSITVRKIVPRKTQVTGTPGPSLRRSPRVSSESNKENVNRLSGPKRERPKISTSTPAPAPPEKCAVLSPILASANGPPEKRDPSVLEWSHKVRRSYSRLSAGDRSFESCSSPSGTSSPVPCRRETLFGFEQLQTPPVAGKRADRSGARAEISLSVCGGSFDLQEGNGSLNDSPECDVNIPGVALVKEKRRRRKVPQIKTSEFDILAAKMNAEFDEAENFDLVVE